MAFSIASFPTPLPIYRGVTSPVVPVDKFYPLHNTSCVGLEEGTIAQNMDAASLMISLSCSSSFALPFPLLDLICLNCQ